VIFVLLCGIAKAHAQTIERPVVSVLDFGATPIAKVSADTLRQRLRASGEVVAADAMLI
jgi:hypothetical protein